MKSDKNKDLDPNEKFQENKNQAIQYLITGETINRNEHKTV